MSQEQFLADDKTIDATVRNLQIIGEATKRLPETFTDEHNHIPWFAIAGFRNRVVHDYHGLDMPFIWELVQKELPRLQRSGHTP